MAQAYEFWKGSWSSLSTKLGGMADLEPLRDHCKSKKTTPAQAASLRALAEGGWWAQADLHSIGVADTDLCQACGAAKGTILHTCASCSLLRTRRAEASEDTEHILREANSLEGARNPLFHRGVPLRDTSADHVPGVPPDERWEIAAGGLTHPLLQHGAMFSGSVITDGSLFHGKPRRSARGE